MQSEFVELNFKARKPGRGVGYSFPFHNFINEENRHSRSRGRHEVITVFTPKERERPIGGAQWSYRLSLLSWFRKVKHSFPTHLR
jgi:hypothetical protein